MMQEILLSVEGINISGQLYLPAGRGPHPTICVCHGIPDRIHDPGDAGYPLLAERISGEGFAALIFNFRGTGASGGNFDITGWTRDLRAVIDHVWTLPEVNRAHISLLGFSGGAAVSIYVAAGDIRVSCVAACACPAEFNFVTGVDDPAAVVEHFRSTGTIREKEFPRSAVKWFDGFRVIRPVEYAAGIAPRPLLIVHGSSDETVDIGHAHRLYERAREPKRLTVIDGAGHRLREDDRAIEAVIDWLKSHCGG